MNFLRLYEANDKPWVDPDAFWEAIRWTKPIKIVHHTEQPNWLPALVAAYQTLHKGFVYSFRSAIRGALICAICSLILSWPLLRFQIPNIAFNILQFGIFGCLVVAIVRAYKTFFDLRFLKRAEWKEPKEIVIGPKLSPPTYAFGKIQFKPVLFSWTLRLLLVAILLNCWVVASPYNPAIITHMGKEPFIFERMAVVPPTTRWEIRPRYTAHEAIAILYAPIAEQIWTIHMHYIVYHADLFVEFPEWEDWLEYRTQSIANYVVNNVLQFVDPELSEAEQAQYLVAELREQGFLPEVDAALYEQFDKHFNNQLRLYNLQIFIHHVTSDELQVIRERIYDL